MRLILLNKPFRVLPQFTSPDERRCLRDYLPVPDVYPAGRLDYDSEGLLALTDFGPWQARISQPGSGLPKTYLVQVEGEPQASQVARLREGVMLPDGPTLPANATLQAPPGGCGHAFRRSAAVVRYPRRGSGWNSSRAAIARSDA